jgi:hypothetical protein
VNDDELVLIGVGQAFDRCRLTTYLRRQLRGSEMTEVQRSGPNVLVPSPAVGGSLHP